MKMIFNVLYLFSPQEKAAKKIEFSAGLNIITSSKEDGTDRGKSVIMRSLYHALGANAYFGSKWNNKDKIYVLQFSIDSKVFFVYRAADLFKIFNGNRDLLFSTTSSTDMAKFLEKYTGFSVQLPNRTDNCLEITPPVYNYLLYFLDQDKYDGTSYKSFNNLGQYTDFKDMVIGYHLGIYTNEYFELIKKKECLQKQADEECNRKELLQAMRRNIESKIEVPAIDYDITVLNAEMDIYKRNYEEILVALRKSKGNLLNLRNQEIETKQSLQDLDDIKASVERDLKMLNKHYCPECKSYLENTINIRSKKYNNEVDALTVKNYLQISLSEIEKDILNEEESYKMLLEKVNDYEKNVDNSQGQIDDILKYMGLCHVRDNIINEQNDVYSKIDDIQEKINKQKEKIKTYTTKKKKINGEYNKMLSSLRMKLKLDEISLDKFKNIRSTFSASGSNKPIATIMWYLTILQLKRKFNPDVIDFPLVLDSPTNAEMDSNKKKMIMQYVLDFFDKEHQMIVSTIGFQKNEFSLNGEENIIYLNNNKYELLDKETYEKYKDFIGELCDAQLRE